MEYTCTHISVNKFCACASHMSIVAASMWQRCDLVFQRQNAFESESLVQAATSLLKMFLLYFTAYFQYRPKAYAKHSMIPVATHFHSPKCYVYK